ncbi:MAG TPA: gamma-glutamylcyclotransferase family protein [Streptomyces sp.]|jgi:gamma-glutamylcyclotransferase (GGCT)/AIG2-like uncharacterized protein YtfP|nr:gamma-glutamylcyclotransferase family protein [Streptomyces sp.]
MSLSPEPLFVYGTLRFPQVLQALLGRVPDSRAGTAAGWRTAALAGRVYPGLVPAADATAEGLLLTGVSPGERERLDEFEGAAYALRPLPMTDGGYAWAYVWQGDEVLDEDWDAEVFAAEHLAGYAARLA